jgi:hypothetical protein
MYSSKDRQETERVKRSDKAAADALALAKADLHRQTALARAERKSAPKLSLSTREIDQFIHKH